jgi:PAS domain S-box-containing protein
MQANAPKLPALSEMSLAESTETLKPLGRSWQRIPWIGGLFIAVIAAMAVWDIVRGYRVAANDTDRELETQARVIAEQTARSVQAVDVVLRHVAGEYKRGRLARLSPDELHHYLRELSVGLKQIDGFGLYDANGIAVARSWDPSDTTMRSIADLPGFHAMRADPQAELGIANVRRADDGVWALPLGRRLETPSGEFAGLVGARGLVSYYQDFYRDIRVNPGTKVTLLHRNGPLLARYPPVEGSLGQRYPAIDATLAARGTGDAGPLRLSSPIDGVERFAAVRAVPDYPLAVVVSRDVDTALAEWRAQAIGTALRTLALSLLAALLLAVLARQLRRLDAAHESLKDSRERFALAVAGSDDGIWDWERESDAIYASPRARELYGLPPGPEKTLREAWHSQVQVHPDDVAPRLGAIEASLEGKTPLYEFEYRVRHPDGQYRWVRARGLCVRDAGGAALRMAGSVSDIDTPRRTEEALRVSEERFARAVEGSNDGILDWDITNDRMFASERAMRIAGIDPDVVVRTHDEWLALLDIHPDDQPAVKRTFRRQPQGGLDAQEADCRVRLGDGSWRWVRFRGRHLSDSHGRATRWSGSISDIDAHKRTEEALRESQERYQLSVAGSSEGMWDWDMRSQTFYFSARAQELLGLAPGEPLRPCEEWWRVFHYHPGDEKRVHDGLKAYLDGNGAHWEVEYRLHHESSDSWRWFRERGVALRDEQGRPYRMAGSLEDVTVRKNAEAERDRLESQLRQSQKLEAMGTLAGGIAHDFNNILAAILGYGEMVQRDCAEGSAQRRHIDAAMSAALRAKSLVERILAFSRSGVGERVRVNVQSVVDEALVATAASLPPPVRLERDLSADDAAVLGDATQIHQVVMNLCANAVQSMRAGGTLNVTLQTTRLAEAKCVSTTELAPGGYVKLTVRDTGTGIEPQVLERIFDPFFTTKAAGMGTGLGLSLVHGIVADLGGGIDVYSRVGAGSTFTVYLPWHGSAQATDAKNEPIASGSGETILLIDDEEALVRLGEEMMAELGYEPVGFASGAAALKTFRDAPQRFDAVLSDEAMPEMTGSELAREIRRIRPDIPIVLMSGYVTQALIDRAREIGIKGVLAKPLAAREIARSLADALHD